MHTATTRIAVPWFVAALWNVVETGGRELGARLGKEGLVREGQRGGGGGGGENGRVDRGRGGQGGDWRWLEEEGALGRRD